MDKKLLEILEENDFRVYEDSMELEDWTSGGYDVIITVEDWTEEKVMEAINDFDPNHEVEIWWDNNEFRSNYNNSMAEALEDMEEWKLDKLKGMKYSFERDFCSGKISADEFLQELALQVDEEEREKEQEERKPKKWYKINSKIVTADKEGNERTEFFQFVVNSTSAERANMLINVYLKQKQDEERARAKEKGNVFDEELITAAIEESAIIPIGVFIPKEFSEVYKE